MDSRNKSVGCVCDRCLAVDYSACPEFEKGLMVGAYIASMLKSVMLTKIQKHLIGLEKKGTANKVQSDSTFKLRGGGDALTYTSTGSPHIIAYTGSKRLAFCLNVVYLFIFKTCTPFK